jgi:hypothetical protein
VRVACSGGRGDRDRGSAEVSGRVRRPLRVWKRQERRGGEVGLHQRPTSPRFSCLCVVCVCFFGPESAPWSGWGRCVECVWSEVIVGARASAARLDDLARVNEGPRAACGPRDVTSYARTPAACSRPAREEGEASDHLIQHEKRSRGSASGARLAPLRCLSNMQKSLRADTLAEHSRV